MNFLIGPPINDINQKTKLKQQKCLCLDKTLKQNKHNLEIASVKIRETGETKSCRMIKLMMITDSNLQPRDALDLSPALNYKINKRVYILKKFKRAGKWNSIPVEVLKMLQKIMCRLQ